MPARENWINYMQKVSLIIDDEEEICQLLASYFKKKKFKTFTALSLKEGLEKFKMHLPDLVVLDNNLPDGSGISAIPNLIKINPDCLVIIISAMSNLADKALAAGATGFIAKPISFNSIDKYLEQLYH